MRKFLTLLIREVRSYFYSPIAYVVMIFFLIISGIDFYFQVSFMNQRQVQYTIQEAFFNSVFFWFAFVLIFPLITMRLFAEEKQLGTIASRIICWGRSGPRVISMSATTNPIRARSRATPYIRMGRAGG